MNKQVHTAILGGGISGLSFAHFYAKSQNDFVLIESQNRTGGIINSETVNDYLCENGPNSILINNNAIKQLLKDCNLYKQTIFPSDSSQKNRYVLHKNELTKIPTSFKQFLKSPLLTMRGKFRILKELFITKHNKNTSVYKFITKRFGQEVHDQLIEPVLTGIYAGNTQNMSAKHSLKLLWELEQKHGSILRGFFSRRKKESIQSFTLPNGIESITKSIHKQLEEKVLLNTCVKKIIKVEKGYEIICQNGIIKCHQIVSTLPAHVLANVIEHKKLSNNLNKIEYTPIDVFHFGFDIKNIHNSKKGFGLLTKPSDNKNYLGILFSSQIFNHCCPKNKAFYTVLVGGERQKEICKKPIYKVQKIIQKELEELLNHQGKVTFSKAFRWKKGIPQYNLNQNELAICIKKFEKDNDNFHVLGNYIGGISVSDCIKKGQKLAHKLIN